MFVSAYEETSQQLEIRKLAAQFGMTIAEVARHFADANDPEAHYEGCRPHPSHRVRQLEPDISFVRVRQNRLAFDD